MRVDRRNTEGRNEKVMSDLAPRAQERLYLLSINDDVVEGETPGGGAAAANGEALDASRVDGQRANRAVALHTKTQTVRVQCGNAAKVRAGPVRPRKRRQHDGAVVIRGNGSPTSPKEMDALEISAEKLKTSAASLDVAVGGPRYPRQTDPRARRDPPATAEGARHQTLLRRADDVIGIDAGAASRHPNRCPQSRRRDVPGDAQCRGTGDWEATGSARPRPSAEELREADEPRAFWRQRRLPARSRRRSSP